MICGLLLLYHQLFNLRARPEMWLKRARPPWLPSCGVPALLFAHSFVPLVLLLLPRAALGLGWPTFAALTRALGLHSLTGAHFQQEGGSLWLPGKVHRSGHEGSLANQDDLRLLRSHHGDQGEETACYRPFQR